MERGLAMLNKKALAASVSAPPAPFVEDVFSTYLYTGNGGGTRSITNGIDLSGEGGLVWLKGRSGISDHVLYDTARGSTPGRIYTNSTAAEDTSYQEFSSFNSDGFSIYHNADAGYINVNNTTYCSWTFRKQAKFFDIVTYTGNGANDQTISHNLGSTPGFIVVKATSTTSAWWCYHRGLSTPNDFQIRLSSDAAAGNTGGNAWNVTSTTFNASGSLLNINASGQTYVAYLFAHNAGGFGEAGTDNVISCGSFSTNTSTTTTVDLGYEPQFVMVKLASGGTGDWYMMDTMRGLTVNNSANTLSANSSSAEVANSAYAVTLTSTGFTIPPASNLNENGYTYIYMAIRRPMKTPTSGTEVFSPTYVPTVVTGTKSTTAFPIDLQILSYTSGTTENQTFVDRLRGVSTNATEGGSYLVSSSTVAEATSPAETRFWDNTGFQQHSYFSGGAARYWNFRRAPKFFDVVCYTGTGSNTTQTHNLGVAPELIIFKGRSLSINWFVYGNITSSDFSRLILNQTGSGITYGYADGAGLTAQPTSTSLSLGSASATNGSGNTYVAYLFATLAGVSKVGSYTGNGSSQTINCGFSAGARFVLIKRTDSTGDWYVFDTARGIVSGNDPFLLLNSTAAEVTTRDAVDPDNSGFIVNNDGTNFPINVNNATYIFYAVA